MPKKNIKIVAIMATLLVTASCRQIPDQHVYESEITENQLISGQAIIGRYLDDDELPEDHVLQMSPEMETFIKNHLQRIDSYSRKARSLSGSIFDDDKLGLRYDPRATFTASSTFENSIGNCLSFSFLYYALAREIGLDVRFQEVEVLPQWTLGDDELFIESKHVNVRVNMPGNRDLVVDIDEVEPARQLEHRLLDEDYVVSLYYSNVGVERLLEKNLQEALKYFVKALHIDYDNSAHWTNLGVLYRRAGLDDYAEKAYYVALSYNKDDKAALSNLAHLYHDAGDEARSEYFSDLVKRYHDKNPYYFYSEARENILDGDLEEALKNINKAIKRKDNVALFYELKGDILAHLGDKFRSRRAQQKAKDIGSVLR